MVISDFSNQVLIFEIDKKNFLKKLHEAYEDQRSYRMESI
jgi:hypothetical protein